MAERDKDAAALHAKLADALPRALGHPLPQMRVEFRGVSVTAERLVLGDGKPSHELPTLVNTVRRAVAGLFATRHVVQTPILRDVTARFRPGTMTLVLGQPGSGKSTLLKLAAARFPVDDKRVDVQGEVCYNGAPIVGDRALRAKIPRLASYVEQQDTHFAALTPRETFAYAHEMTGSELYRRGRELLVHGTPDANAAALEAVQALEAAYPELVIEQLGLRGCADTRLGDSMTRGVSGGERKRVTTGEMAFGLKPVALMDEISTGLDSAATFDIVRAVGESARTLGRAVVVSLLQPSPEVVALFDDVMVLHAGHVLYYGPTRGVDAYFSSLGFRRPGGRDVADFLLDLATDEQRVYERGAQGKAAGACPRTSEELAEAYKQSAVYRSLLAEMESQAEGGEPLVGALLARTPSFHQSLWANTLTLTRRELVLSARNTKFLASRVSMVVLMGLIYGSLYWQADMTDVQVVLGVLFSSVLFLMLGQTAQIATFVDARAVFYKQRGANMVRSAAYVAAACLRQLPLAVAEALAFGAMVYWMVGFQASLARFLVFEALFVSTILVYVSWFFLLAAVSPSQNVMFPIIMVSIVFFILFTGFVMPRGEIPGYLVWVYWIDPLAWVLRALAVNEYRYGDLAACEYQGVDYCAQLGMTAGEYLLSLFDVPASKHWVPLAFVFLAAVYILSMMLACLVLERVRYESPASASEAVAAAAETPTARRAREAAGGGDDDDDDKYSAVATPRSAAAAADYAVTIEAPAMARRPVLPVTLAFEDVRYSVPAPSGSRSSDTVELLRGVSGFARPGTITALMGSTGAGKTTLLDVIAGRKQGGGAAGAVRGRILLNGHAATPLAIQRCAGYCEQQDVHAEAATFREALAFSAFLRQDSAVPAREKLETVAECLTLLGLARVADRVVRGSSGEQRKRLSIGVELAARPSVLFLDEPTSGLDARAAKLIMDGVRKVADTGRTVVCTIHQPSAEVFQVFDSLLLLQLGGRAAYFGELGPGCRTLVDYLEAVPGVRPLPEAYNPATWMLEVIGAGVGRDHGPASSAPWAAAAASTDFADVFARSPQRERLAEALRAPGVGCASPDAPALAFRRKRAAGAATQLRLLVQRFAREYWRTPSYNLTRVGVYAVLAALFGLLFLGVEYDSYQGINAGLGVVSLTVIFTGFMSFNSVLPLTMADREAYYRERAAQTYSALWYLAGATAAELPYVAVLGLLFTAVFFPLVGFSGAAAFALFWLNTALLMLQQTFLGQLLAYALPSLEVAALLGATVNSILMMFVGFNPPAAAIPRAYRWLYHLTPQHYSMSILAAVVFGECDDPPAWDAAAGQYVGGGDQLGCRPLRGAPLAVGHTTVKEFLESNFHMRRDELWTNVAVTLAFTLAFRLLALVALRFVNHQKK